MPFIGNQPALSYTSFAKQDFTTSATTSYVLSQPVANANEIALFINFVRQEPTTAYTASGTSLTLTSATSASDDMYAIFLGKALQTVNPPAGSVGASQITDGSITSAKLAGSIGLDKLSATGTKDATTFLRGDNTFQAVSSDYVLLATTSASNVATLDLNGYFSGTYQNYKLIVEGFYGTTNVNNFKLRFATGSYTVQTSSYGDISGWGGVSPEQSGTTSSGSSGGSGSGIFIGHNSSDANYRNNTEITIFNPLSSYYKHITALTQYWNGSGTLRTANTSGTWLNSTAVTGIRLYFEGGNLYANSIKLYGIK